jgi:Cys-tRNA(Pro)/Cys-tRNA(Cys) deacylase
MKTNAARLLDGLGIRYSLHEYEVDEDDLSAPTVAKKVNLPVEQVWKTLVIRGEVVGPVFAVVPGNVEVDLKALARAAGDKRMTPVPLKEVLGLTGYIRGGVTVFGAKKAFPVFVDELIQLFDLVSVSAGARGTQIFLAPTDYIQATHATLASIT